jgi:hypothetical protein
MGPPDIKFSPRGIGWKPPQVRCSPTLHGLHVRVKPADLAAHPRTLPATMTPDATSPQATASGDQRRSPGAGSWAPIADGRLGFLSGLAGSSGLYAASPLDDENLGFGCGVGEVFVARSA